MPWEGPGQLGEGWPRPIRRAQPLRGCWHLRGGGIWGQPGAALPGFSPLLGAAARRALGAPFAAALVIFFFICFFPLAF